MFKKGECVSHMAQKSSDAASRDVQTVSLREQKRNDAAMRDVPTNLGKEEFASRMVRR